MGTALTELPIFMWKYVSVCDGAKLCFAAVLILVINAHTQKRLSTGVTRRDRRCTAGVCEKVEQSEKLRNKNVVKVNCRIAVYFS
jgi:hypothetical protein